MDLNLFTSAEVNVLSSWTEQLAKAFDYADGENPLNQPRTGTMFKLLAEYLTKSGAVALPVINKTGGSLAVNKALAITGYDVTTGAFKVDVASNTGSIAVGVLEAALADGAQTSLRSQFQLSTSGLNTAASTIGNPVYLSTAGGLTLTAPTAVGAVVQVLGYVKTLAASGTLVIQVRAPAPLSATSALAALRKTAVTIPNLSTSYSAAKPADFVNDKPCFASISGNIAGSGPMNNAVAVSQVVCASGNLSVVLTGDPGAGGAAITVFQDIR